MTSSKFTNILMWTIITLLVLNVGAESYQDSLDDQNRYCDNVKSKLWPDYQKNYKDICKKDVDS